MFLIRKKVLIVFFSILTIYAFLLLLSLNELNPDWTGYKAIYTSDGAWLKETSRDPLFLALNRLAVTFFGEDNYLFFRASLAIYFFIFLIFLSSGNLIPISRKKFSILFVTLSILALGYLRFTVQVREGVALTFMLFSLGLFFSCDSKVNRYGNQVGIKNKVALIFMFLSMLFHSAMFPIMIFYLFSVWIKRERDVTSINRAKLIFLWALIWMGTIALIIQIELNLWLGEVINSRSFERQAATGSPVYLQYLKIIIYGGLSIISLREAKRLSTTLSPKKSSLLLVFTGPAQSMLIFASFLSIALGLPPLITGDFTRQFVLIFSMSCLLMSFFGSKNKLLIIGLLALSIDGVRAVFISIDTTYGVELFN
jgi:hypothetical protein